MKRSCAATALAIVSAVTFAVMAGLSARPALAEDPFQGRWASDPAGCAGGAGSAMNAPLTVTATAVTWSGSTCAIKKSYRIGDTLALQTNCSGGSKTGVIPIGLTLRGRDRISVIWDQTPAGEMRRCK